MKIDNKFVTYGLILLVALGFTFSNSDFADAKRKTFRDRIKEHRANFHKNRIERRKIRRELLQQLKKRHQDEFTNKEEYFIGRNIAARFLAKHKTYQQKGKKLGTTPLDSYLNKIGMTLSMASNRPETYHGYRIILLDTSSINAFAIPGGTIFITTGIVQRCSSEDEVAAVLAHEVAHIELKHPTKSISRAKRAEAIGELIKHRLEKRYSRIKIAKRREKLQHRVDTLVNNIEHKISNGYDHFQEKQADLRAVNVLIRAGYSPYALSSILKKLTTGGGVHGDPKQRANHVDMKIRHFAKVPSISEARTKRFQGYKGMLQ